MSLALRTVCLFLALIVATTTALSQEVKPRSGSIVVRVLVDPPWLEGYIVRHLERRSETITVTYFADRENETDTRSKNAGVVVAGDGHRVIQATLGDVSIEASYTAWAEVPARGIINRRIPMSRRTVIQAGSTSASVSLCFTPWRVDARPTPSDGFRLFAAPTSRQLSDLSQAYLVGSSAIDRDTAQPFFFVQSPNLATILFFQGCVETRTFARLVKVDSASGAGPRTEPVPLEARKIQNSDVNPPFGTVEFLFPEEPHAPQR